MEERKFGKKTRWWLVNQGQQSCTQPPWRYIAKGNREIVVGPLTSKEGLSMPKLKCILKELILGPGYFLGYQSGLADPFFGYSASIASEGCVTCSCVFGLPKCEEQILFPIPLSQRNFWGVWDCLFCFSAFCFLLLYISSEYIVYKLICTF